MSSARTAELPRPSHVLLAEDDPQDFFLLQRAITKYISGVTVTRACDGEEAISILQKLGSAPDLILTDLKMPKVDGFQFLEWLKSHPQFSSVPAVIFSSSDQDRDHERAKQLGADGYHVKPGDHAAFVSLIQQLCRQFLDRAPA